MNDEQSNSNKPELNNENQNLYDNDNPTTGGIKLDSSKLNSVDTNNTSMNGDNSSEANDITNSNQPNWNDNYDNPNQPNWSDGYSNQSSNQPNWNDSYNNQNSNQPNWGDGYNNQNSNQPNWNDGYNNQNSNQPNWGDGYNNQNSNQPNWNNDYNNSNPNQPNWNNGYNNNNPNQSNWNNSYNNNNFVNKKPEANGYVIAAFILSLISILVCCCSPSYLPIPIILAVGSIVLAIISKQKKKMHGLSIASIIISIFAIIGFLFVFLIRIYMQTPEGQTYMNEFYEEFYQQYNDGDFDDDDDSYDFDSVF